MNESNDDYNGQYAMPSSYMRFNDPNYYRPRNQSRIHLDCATERLMKAVKWAIKSWLPAEKLTILMGAPATGKTTIAIGIAAHLTHEGPHPSWPDPTNTAYGNVLFVCTEDDFADTIKPRLLAAGANMARVFDFKINRAHYAAKPPYTLSIDDFQDLKQEIERIPDGVALIIIDPVTQIIANDASMSKARTVYTALGDLAADLECAILGITHTSKFTKGRDPINRIAGSGVVTQIARSIMVVAKIKNGTRIDGADYVLVCAKSSLSNVNVGFGYSIKCVELVDENRKTVQTTKINWHNPIDGIAAQILSDAENSTDGEKISSKLDEAKTFLLQTLKNGQKKSKEIDELANQVGISMGSIARAKVALQINSKKLPGGQTWCCLPPTILGA